jgi:glycosidase
MKHTDPLVAAIYNQYKLIYGSLPTFETSFSSFLNVLESYKAKRSGFLQQIDLEPNWFQSSKMVGVTLYIDLFSKDLKNFIKKVDYFVDLGITYIHLMPLLRAREGNSDGGYAVADYKDVDPRLGSMDDLKKVIEVYQSKGIAIAIDFVINHTAKEHRWALEAMKGNKTFQDYYLMYDNEAIPNEFNKTVPEVLPDIYPGNFTYYPQIKKFVFKSFSEFQWDLNFANPKVMEEIIDIFLFLANIGVRMIRLDAIPFVWKELGTTCRNLPMVHQIMHLFQLIKAYVAPGVAILGEAIVEPHEIYKYFGTEKAKECDVLYNATMMVNIWEALATRDGRLLAVENQRFPLPKQNAWINYARCHDDIGWGFNEDFIRSTGRDPFAHKQYLINFYNGRFPNSFSRGQNYQENTKTKDARTNGTLASLSGMEQALAYKNETMIHLAYKRFELIHRLIYAIPGMPLIYSGDEWLQLNDYDHAKDESKTDGRWLHRPAFNWDKVTTSSILEQQAYQLIRQLNTVRKEESIFDADASMEMLTNLPQAVFGFVREKGKKVFCLFNVSEFPQSVQLNALDNGSVILTDLVSKEEKLVFDQWVHLQPYESLYLTRR